MKLKILGLWTWTRRIFLQLNSLHQYQFCWIHRSIIFSFFFFVNSSFTLITLIFSWHDLWISPFTSYTVRCTYIATSYLCSETPHFEYCNMTIPQLSLIYKIFSFFFFFSPLFQHTQKITRNFFHIQCVWTLASTPHSYIHSL